MEVEVLEIFVLLCIDNAVFLLLYFLHIKRNKEMYGFVTNITQHIYMYNVHVYTILFKINLYFAARPKGGGDRRC